MKTVIFFAAVIVLSGCEIYYDPFYTPVDRVEGRYEVQEYSETYNDFTHYTIWIERSHSNSHEIRIDNFYGVDIRVYATLSYDRITIHRQTVNGYTIEGTGTLYGDELSLHYSVRDILTGAHTDFCEATGWRD